MSVTAMIAKNDVAIPKVGEHSDSIGLLSQVSMGGTEKYAFGEFFQNSFFEAANTVKLAVNLVRSVHHGGIILYQWGVFHASRSKLGSIGVQVSQFIPLFPW